MEKLSNLSAYLKNALSLAYLGDAVFSLMVREFLVKSTDLKTNELNKKANSVVKATNQAEIMAKLVADLTDDELDIVKRARNAHPNNKAKSSSLHEYNLSTQFEALVGYWYLQNEQEKLNRMFNSYVVEKLC